MQAVLVIAVSLHLLAGIFWAGTTFTLARTGGARAEGLFRPQMGAAVVAVLAGGYLWGQLHPTGTSGMVLGLGALCAVAAAGVQGAIGGKAIRGLRTGALSEADARPRIVTAQRIASALLVVTIVSMGVANYV